MVACNSYSDRQVTFRLQVLLIQEAARCAIFEASTFDGWTPLPISYGPASRKRKSSLRDTVVFEAKFLVSESSFHAARYCTHDQLIPKNSNIDH